ncbi:hypothetical protein HMPREF2955_10460 [Prevotella sp. HMSC073D09]|nr:hypothetical protein HMPREF2955_10460 [Prevotella sp. HMSC073D09]
MCFMVLKGYIYTIAAYVYAYRSTFSGKKYCILHQNTLHFVPKHTAFSTKTRCILRQNARHFAPKRTTFSGKQAQKWCK